jgi:hypothetical protein
VVPTPSMTTNFLTDSYLNEDGLLLIPAPQEVEL